MTAPIMDRDYWIRAIEDDVKFCARRLAETGNITPMTTLHTKDGLIPVLTPFPEGDKSACSTIMAAFCIAYEAEGVVSMAEAWMSTRQHGERPDVPPSQDPDRVEIVNIVASYYDPADGSRKTMAIMRPILRDDNGTPRLGEADPDKPDYGKQEGFISGFLPQKRITDPEAKRLAKRVVDSMRIDTMKPPRFKQ